MSDVTFVDLLAGGGGWSLGLEQAGLIPILLNDRDVHCVNTLKANRPEWPVVQYDLRIPSWDLGELNPDVVVAGIPCQPFSLCGNLSKEKDDRDCSVAVLDRVLELNPTIAIFENVRQYCGTEGHDKLVNGLEHAGYTTNDGIFCYADYGVCQNRKRWFLVAFKCKQWQWPVPSHAEYPDEELFQVKKPWIKFNKIKDKLQGRLVSTKRLKWQFADARKAKDRLFTTHIVGYSDIMPTIVSNILYAGHQAVFIHEKNGVLRYPTLLEAARAQGFPDDWEFVASSKGENGRMIANAVVPPFGRSLGESVLKALKGDY